jgi:hypothetical protein
MDGFGNDPFVVFMIVIVLFLFPVGFMLLLLAKQDFIKDYS